MLESTIEARMLLKTKETRAKCLAKIRTFTAILTLNIGHLRRLLPHNVKQVGLMRTDLGRRGPRGDVIAAQQIVPQVSAQARSGGHVSEALPNIKVIRVGFLVPAFVKAPHRFQDHGVGSGGAEMQVGQEGHQAGAVVRRNRQVVRIGQHRDFSPFGNSPGPNQVGHGDARGVRFQDLAVGETREQSLADGVGHAGFGSQARQIIGAVGLNHVLHPQRVVRLEGPRDADGARFPRPGGRL